MQLYTFHPHQDYEQNNFNKLRLYIIRRSDRDGNSTVFYNWLKNGTFQPKFDKNYFFNQHSQPFYDVIQKEAENPEFV